jgi:hypothetical protein
MSRETRKALLTLKSTVREHMATNPLLRSEFMEWIEGTKELLVKNLILENNEITRGQIQMLDKIKDDLQIGE